MHISSLPGPASYAVAAAARSILTCPAAADLEVDRLPLPLDDAVLGERAVRPAPPTWAGCWRRASPRP